MNLLGHKHLLNNGKVVLPDYPVFSSVSSEVTVDAGATNINVSYPSTVNANDIIIMVVSKGDWDYNIAATGWTKITSTSYPHTHVFWKRAIGTESGTQAVTLIVGTEKTTGYMVSYSGCVETGNPWVSAGATNTAANVIQVSVGFLQRHKAIGIVGTVLNSPFTQQYSLPCSERLEDYGAPGSFFIDYDIPDDYIQNPPTYTNMRVSNGGAKLTIMIRFYLVPK
jgi:hypothetical protein